MIFIDKMAKYLQGKYTLKNPEKYVGDKSNIFYRSSWELKAFIWFDTTPSILKWQSEELQICYISPVDGKSHRYFPDMVVLYKTKTGETKRAIVEIKPKAQCKEPNKPKKMTKRYITEVTTWCVNQAKWKAAEEWCASNNFNFLVLTEDHLNV